MFEEPVFTLEKYDDLEDQEVCINGFSCGVLEYTVNGVKTAVPCDVESYRDRIVTSLLTDGRNDNLDWADGDITIEVYHSHGDEPVKGRWYRNGVPERIARVERELSEWAEKSLSNQ